MQKYHLFFCTHVQCFWEWNGVYFGFFSNKMHMNIHMCACLQCLSLVYVWFATISCFMHTVTLSTSLCNLYVSVFLSLSLSLLLSPPPPPSLCLHIKIMTKQKFVSSLHVPSIKQTYLLKTLHLCLPVFKMVVLLVDARQTLPFAIFISEVFKSLCSPLII